MKRLSVLVVIVCLLTAGVPMSAAAAPRGGQSRVVWLGQVIHDGRLVEGYAFIHGRAHPARPEKPSRADQLYTYLARGAKWRSTEPFVVNPANGDGVSASLIDDAFGDATGAWESAAAYDVFSAASLTNSSLAADYAAPDGVNEAYFSQTELDSQTVAITVVWGVFSGAPNTRQLIEWDMVFNDALSRPWGDAAVQAGTWDVAGITTHELGHSAGLGDLYTTAAVEQTMYGYASPGETKKRTLESGDIAGISGLY